MDMKLTDKDLHCISRNIQWMRWSEEMDSSEACCFCKYIDECHEKYKGKVYSYFEDVVAPKLKELTQVDAICMMVSKRADAVREGSWIKDHPCIEEKLRNHSIDEQLDILLAEGILHKHILNRRAYNLRSFQDEAG